MAGKNVRIAVHYKEETAQLLAAEISRALSTQTVSVTKIDVSQAFSGLESQLDSFFRNYRPEALSGLGNAISSALNTGINTTMMASAFEGISAGARSAATALNSLSEAEEKEKLAQSEYVRQAGIIQKQLQNFFKSGANGNALYAGLDNLKMKVSGEVATFTAINEKMGKTVSITANLSEGWGESKKNAAAFAQQIDKIAKISATIKAPLPSPSEASAQASNIFTAIKSASSNGSNPLLAGLSDWSIKFNDTTATITAQNKALGSTTQIIADLTKGYGASAQSAETFVKQLDSLARISTRINESAAEKQVSLSNEEAQAQARTLFEQIKEVSAHSTSGPLQGLTDWTVKVSGMKATFSAINEEMGRSVTAEADLAKGMGANADLAAEWAKNIQSGTDKLSVTTKELPKLLSPTEASAQRDNILAALQTASADGSTPALAGLTDWQARLSGTKAIFTAINTDLKQSVSVTADLRTHVGDTAQSAAQFAQNLTAANISTKDVTSSLDSEATKLTRLRSQAEQYLTLKGKILKENAPDVYNRLDSLYRKSFTPGAVSSSEFQKEYSAIQSQIFQTGADIQSLWQRIKSAGEIAFTFYNLYGVFNRVKRVVKDMVQTAGELNQSMTQLSIVSNESMKTIESNFGNISKAAKEAGADITDLMASMENYARMGYNMQESTDLAKLTSIYSNVGDISVDDATTSAVSILKAYGLSVNELKQAFDSMTKVDQDFAISTGDLGVAFQNTGSQLAATGASVNETIALITAANSSIQDASKTANALKTISMRLRSQNLTQKEREELSELSGEDIDDIVNNSSKYRNEILGMTGVDIKENESTYKSIYQIILEISKVWDHLSDTQRATLTEDIAGKRNSSVLMSLISNVDDMEKAYADAENAAGTLDAANAKYLDSIEGRQKAFQASYQSLAHTLVNSNFVKVFYDMGNGAMQFAEGLQKVHLLIPSVIAGLVALNAAMKTFQATSGVVKMLSAPTTTLESAVQVLGALPRSSQSLAGMMLQGMNPAQKATLLGGDIRSVNWVQGRLLDASKRPSGGFTFGLSPFVGASNDELEDFIERDVKSTIGQGFQEGAKKAGEDAEKATGTVFEALKAKVKAGLTGIKKLLTGGFGTGAAVAGWAGIAVGIGAAIYKIIDTINTKRIEAYRNLKTEISDTENKIREAQKQIDENNAAIEEYTEKKIAAGALSLSDQTTLDTLKAEQNELQVNIELWEAYAEARRAELSDKAWDALKAEAAKPKNQVDLVTDVSEYKDFIRAANALSTSDENLKLASDKSSDKYDLTLVGWLSASGYYQDEAKWRQTMVANATGWLDANRDQLNDLVYGTDKNIDELIDSYHRLDAYVLTTSGNWDSAFSTLINAPEFAETKTYLEGIVDMYGGTADNISKMAEQIKNDGEKKLNDVDLNKFLDTLEDLGFTVNRLDFSDLIRQFGSLTDSIDGLSGSTNSLYQFQSAMEGVDAEVDDWEKGEKKRKSGTEAFTSYAETYAEFKDRIKKFDIDDGIIAEDVERLIGADKIIELGGDKDKIKKYINEYVKPLFGNANSLGGGLPKRLLELSKGWKENTEGVKEFKNAQGQLVMSVDKANDRWDISSEHMDEAAEALGITTQALYALMSAIDTWGEIDKISDEDLENKILESNMGISLAGGKKGVMVAELTAEWTSAGINAVEQAQLIARLTKSKNVIVLDAEFTGNTKEDIEKLKEIGLISEGKFRTVDVDDRGKRILAPTERIANIEGIAKVFKQMGKDFGATWEEINDIIKESGISEEIYNQEVRLNDLIKAYSDGAVDIQNFYDTITVGGKKVKIIKFGSLEESLRDAGFSAENIDKILRKLANERGEVRISAYMDWSNYRERDLKSRLRSMGILSAGENGQYTLNIDALVKTTIDQGGSMADAEGAVQQIVNLFNGTPLSLNLDTLEEEVKTAWDKAISGKTTEANEIADASEKAADASERAEKALKGSDGDLDSIVSKVRTIQSMAITIADMFARAFQNYSNLPTAGKPGAPLRPGDKPKYGAVAATGKNNDKYSGLSLVGELGPEIRATDGMVEVVGKNGPEVITVGKDDIIIDADTTAGILKKTGGVIDGIASNANYGGSLSYTPPGGGSGSSSSSSSSSAESAASKSKDAWDRFYKDLKHEREMDHISDAEYYAALEANYRNYLDTSEENLDTWQSVVAEIYKGNYSTLTDLWNKELEDWDHRIAMQKATEADKLAWMKEHSDEYLSDNLQQHKEYQKAKEEIFKGEYKILTDQWDKELSEWDHRIAMEEATEEEKTEWMKANLGDYLSDNLTQHEDYEKALESIHDGEVKAQTDAWDEIKDNLDRQLAMNEISEKEYWARYAKAYRETLVGNQKKVADERLKADKDYYEATKKLAEDAIKAQTDKLKRLLDNNIISYQQYLSNLATLIEKTYASVNATDADSVEARAEALQSLYSAQKDYASKNASDIKSLHDLVVEEIKDIKNQEIDQLEETAANLATIADLRKKAIDDLETENDYIRQQRNLQKSAAQIEAELEMMKSDTSAAGMAKRRKLQEQLTSAQADLSDFEREHAISNQKKQIDEELKSKTDQLDEQKKAIQKYLANELAVSNDAWARINAANAKGVEGIKDLYDELSDYALSFGKDIQDEIDTTVSKFQAAMKAVTKDFGIVINAFKSSGFTPGEMFNILDAAGVTFDANASESVKKAVGTGSDGAIDEVPDWNDESEAAMFAALATAVDDSGEALTIGSIAAIAQQKSMQSLVMTTTKATGYTGEFAKKNIDVADVVAALNKKLEAEGSTLRANAKNYEELNKWLVDNKISTYLFVAAMDEYSSSVKTNKSAWDEATLAVEKSVSVGLATSLQFKNIQNSIDSANTSYGAFKQELISSNTTILPPFTTFIENLGAKTKDGSTTLYDMFKQSMDKIGGKASVTGADVYNSFDQAFNDTEKRSEGAKTEVEQNLGDIAGSVKQTNDAVAATTPVTPDQQSAAEKYGEALGKILDFVNKIVEKFNTAVNPSDPLGLEAAGDDIDTFESKFQNFEETLSQRLVAAAAGMQKLKDAAAGSDPNAPLTADDARRALRISAKLDDPTAWQSERYDLDADGRITADDAVRILRKAAKLGYATGIDSVPESGLYTIDEGMRDELIYDPSKNALISYLNAKSIVFPADVSAKMKALYNNPSLLNTPIGSPSIPRMDATVNAVSVGDISMGDIIIQGNTNEKTVAQIRAEQKKQAQYIGAIFEREQRFAGTIR